MDEELIGQKREITGESLVQCDLCGLPHAASTLLVISGRRPGGEPVDSLRACPACRELIERDDAPFDAVAEAARLPRTEAG